MKNKAELSFEITKTALAHYVASSDPSNITVKCELSEERVTLSVRSLANDWYDVSRCANYEELGLAEPEFLLSDSEHLSDIVERLRASGEGEPQDIEWMRTLVQKLKQE